MSDRLTYVLENFYLWCPARHIQVAYGGEGPLSINRRSDDFFGGRKDIDPDQVVWKEWKGTRIPFLFAADDRAPILTREGSKVIIHYDIIGAAFYFLSGWGEWVCEARDTYGRIPFTSSLIQRLGIITLPVVNYYFDILREAITLLTGPVATRAWRNAPYAVALTHDIDSCRSAWLEGSLSEVRKKHFLSPFRLVWRRFLGRDDWFNFDTIASIEQRHNATSSFYFLPQRGSAGHGRKNADYAITSPSIQEAMKRLRSAGNEVGVHGSFGTHDDPDRFQEDVDRIGQPPAVGCRFHFLCFDLARSVHVLESSGIRYDTTLGFAEHIGFRRGICYPFYLYDHGEGRASNVLEFPLNVMDTTLDYKKYMGISQDEAFVQIVGLLEEVKKFNGVLTLLWHNNYFSDYKYTGWRAVYEKVLAHCRSENAWLTNGRTLYEYITGK